MEYLFGKDIFLSSDQGVAAFSTDYLDDTDASGSVNDFTNGEPFARDLLSVFPSRRSLIDFGTATGHVPLTMRRAGMLAIGLEGSDKPKQRDLGAWGEMPDIVHVCDIGKPFLIQDVEGKGVMFDFVTSWGVFEHVPLPDFDECLKNVLRLMHDNSFGVLNIDLGYNPADDFHMLWRHFEPNCGPEEVPAKHAFLRDRLSSFFDVIYATGASEKELIVIPPTRDLVGEEKAVIRHWNYCRPTAPERACNERLAIHPHSGRSYWWVKKRRAA